MAITLFFMNNSDAVRQTKSQIRINAKTFVHKNKMRMSKMRISRRVLLHKRKTRIQRRILSHAFKKGDAVTANLLARVAALEKIFSEMAIAQPRQEKLANNPPLPPPRPDNTENQVEKADRQGQAETADTQAPGQFKVDVQASQRALERTLAKSGVLLLPTWYLDSDFNFTFSHRENQNFAYNNPQGNPLIQTVALASQSRQDVFSPSLAVRLGLPFDAQLELSLPYQFMSQSEVAPPLTGESKASGSGFGDLQIGFAKALLKEDQWWPDLIARVNWNTDSGSVRDGGLGLGGGIQSVTGSFSALKRQDPLAFFVNTSYTKSFTAKDYLVGANGTMSSYNPGDSIGFSFGTQLAASADTSLSFSLNQRFIGNAEQGSQTIAGSSRNVSILSIGASSIVSRNVFVNLSVGMGLTHDAPDYTAGISISTRTNLKPYLGLD